MLKAFGAEGHHAAAVPPDIPTATDDGQRIAKETRIRFSQTKFTRASAGRIRTPGPELGSGEER